MNMPTDNLPDVNQFAAAATQPAGGGDGPDAIKLTEPGEFLYGVVTATKYGLTTQYGDADLIEMADQQRGPVAFWCTNARPATGSSTARTRRAVRCRPATCCTSGSTASRPSTAAKPCRCTASTCRPREAPPPPPLLLFLRQPTHGVRHLPDRNSQARPRSDLTVSGCAAMFLV